MSVGLPVFNGERFLDQAIRTMLAQDHEHVELIISDNASTDGTREICEVYAAADSRVRYLRATTNHGAAWNYNRVVAEASGKYFKWLAHDDAHETTYVSRCVEQLESDPRLVLSHSAAVDIDETGRTVGTWAARGLARSVDRVERFRDVLMRSGACLEVFGVIRAEALGRTSLIGAYAKSDVPLLAHLALLGPFGSIPEPLFLHREHPDRSVRRHPTDREREAWFSPHRDSRLTYPHWRLLLEFHRMIREDGDVDRVRLTGVLGAWCVRRRGALAREALDGLRIRGAAVTRHGARTGTVAGAIRPSNDVSSIPLFDDALPGLVSVIVSAADDSKVVARQLAALEGQDYPGSWETLVIDNASRDRTDVVVTGWGARLPALAVIRLPHAVSTTVANRIGAERARGEILLYCQANGTVPTNWISSLVRALAAADIVVGPVLDRVEGPGATRRRGGSTPVTRPTAANLGMTRGAYDALGGWSSAYRFGGEAVDLCLRATGAGLRVDSARVVVLSTPRGHGLRRFANGLVAAPRRTARLIHDHRRLTLAPARHPWQQRLHDPASEQMPA